MFEGLQREADRIDWWSLPVKGHVRMVRRRHGGGYFSILTPPEGTSATKRVAYRSRFVHLAVGYPGLKFLPDLQAYRQRYQDYGKVVNAYEPHEHVYDDLQRHPGTVVLRGGGIVASRVLQRLIDDRDRAGAQTQIIHLFRTYISGSHGPSTRSCRRKGGDGWAYQGFNWPKSTWGGQLNHRVEKLEGEDRKRLYELHGGTNTPKRKLWQRQLARGRREGWYRVAVGTVEEVVPGRRGNQDVVVTKIRVGGDVVELDADYIVDATGLEADIREHRVLADLLDHSDAEPNPLDKLAVERNFEIRGTRSEPGRVYAVGSSTLGSYFPGVDTFLGLQFAALRIADDLAKQGFGRRIGFTRLDRRSGGAGLCDRKSALIRGPDADRSPADAHLRAGRHRGRSGRSSSTPLLPPAEASLGEKYQATFTVLAARTGPRTRVGAPLPPPPAVPLGEGLAGVLRPAHRHQRGDPGVGDRQLDRPARRPRCHRMGVRHRLRHGVAGDLDVRERSHARALPAVAVPRRTHPVNRRAEDR